MSEQTIERVDTIATDPSPRPLSRLDQALTDAIEVAHAHGVDADITPADFALQRSEPGYTHATHVNRTHLIAVTFGGPPDEEETVCIGVGEIAWRHFPLDPSCAMCGPTPEAVTPDE